MQGDSSQVAMRGGVEWAARRLGDVFSLAVVVREGEQLDYYYTIEGWIHDNRCDLAAEQLVRIKYRLDRNGLRGTESGRVNLFTTDACEPDSPTIVARLYNEKRGTPRPLGVATPCFISFSGRRSGRKDARNIAGVLAADPPGREFAGGGGGR